MRLLKAFGQFWYDFIIGDDWKIAATVVIALFVLYLAVAAQLFGDAGLTILGGILIVAAFATSLAIDVRPKKN
jgi:hypothetical protein